ncbi:amino acid ABC transporter permease [Azohydromonas lata]|uniref:Amino acid ABC transporter permease n=1 Tax=Azohydromonas lata TaxID=45677 RepID=A0ABU5IFZ7_9BURK|nr:amino acid ABC transporter permease [Azohydromonas lata]MDZ5458039.1 amino acid ABC transporter permease [Azohydromonas lata]
MLSFDPDLLLHGTYAGWLWQGLLTSLRLTLVALLCALPLAAAVAMMRMAPQRSLRAMAAGYVEGVRGVPLLAHLLFWYFGAPELLPESWKQALYEHDVEFAGAAVALTLYAAAYMAEDIRSGLRAVPAGQLDAARALGLGYVTAMRLVVLPQAVRTTLPPLLSQTLNLWKDSSVATVVGVGELMYQAARVESASFRSAEAFTFATLAYLTVSLALTALAALLQRRWTPRGA